MQVVIKTADEQLVHMSFNIVTGNVRNASILLQSVNFGPVMTMLTPSKATIISSQNTSEAPALYSASFAGEDESADSETCKWSFILESLHIAFMQ